MLTGEWSGVYGYPGDIEDSVNFFARLQEDTGILSGDISEPNSMGVLADFLYAHLSGHRDGLVINFIKTYDGSGDFAHSVFYEGLIEKGGQKITGSWKINSLSGWFEMSRENNGEEIKEEVKEAISIEM